jgi:hypothetical protein
VDEVIILLAFFLPPFLGICFKYSSLRSSEVAGIETWIFQPLGILRKVLKSWTLAEDVEEVGDVSRFTLKRGGKSVELEICM